MGYSTRRFVLCLTLCHFVLVFFGLFSIAITSLGEERANLSVFVRLFDLSCLVLSVSSSSWCLGRAAVCDCGTPWNFFLPFFCHYVFVPHHSFSSFGEWKAVTSAHLGIFIYMCVVFHDRESILFTTAVFHSYNKLL